jgi:hypothetical protein
MKRRDGRAVTVVAVVVLAALVGVIAIISIWANRQLLDTGSWVSSSGKALENRVVRDRVGDFLADAVTGLAGEGSSGPGRGGLPVGVRRQLRDEAKKLTGRVLTSAQFRAVWLRANQIAHRALVRILEEKGSSQGGGRLAIDLTPAVRDAVGSLGGKELRSLIKPNTATIEVIEPHQLQTARRVVRVMRRVPIPAMVAFVLLVALALFLGRAWPWRTLGYVGLGVLAAGVISLIVRVIAGHEIIDTLLSHATDRAAAEAAWGIVTSLIVDLSVAAIGLGGLLALWALLMGERPPARACRRALGPLLVAPRTRIAMSLAVAAAFLILVLWSPIAALESPIGIALFAAVIAGAAMTLGRLSILEEVRSPAPL